MTFRPFLAALLFATTLVSAEPEKVTSPPSKESLIEQLFTERDPKAFPGLIKLAEKLAVPTQTRLEASFLFYVDQNDSASIAKLSPQLVAIGDKFDLNQSQIFAQKEDWQAVVHYSQALAALEKNDTAGFKSHITEAFWLSPAQAPAFAPHIRKLRLKQAMKSLTLDLKTLVLPSMTAGEASVHLNKAITEKKSPAVLLYFWSPWSQDSDLTLRRFTSISSSVEAANIPVASILLSPEEEAIVDANNLRKEVAPKAAGIWVTDRQKEPLARLLHATQPSTVVLVSSTGKILFNGSPDEPEFLVAVKKAAPHFKSP